MLRRLTAFLRSPAVILSELGLVVLTTALGGAIPQTGTAAASQLAAFRENGWIPAFVVDGLGLDHVFHSIGFLLLVLATTGSLGMVLVGQLRRLRAEWFRRLSPEEFRSAPFQIEFDRPSRGDSVVGTTWTENKMGVAGPVLVHAGLLLVIAAAGLRALLGVDAAKDLIAGETLDVTAEAWGAQWPGIIAKPFRVQEPLTLQTVRATRYEKGGLRELQVRLALGQHQLELGINQEYRTPSGRLYIGSEHGPAALLEWGASSGAVTRQAAYLAGQAGGEYEAAVASPEGATAHLRAQFGPNGEPAESVEIRVMKGGGLLYSGDLRPGETVSLPGGTKMALQGISSWARVRGSRDSALWLAYAGFGLLLLGAGLSFTLIRADFCVETLQMGERERVFVALKPRRLAPLFEERFERLVGQERSASADPAPASPALAQQTARVQSRSVAAAVTAAVLLLGAPIVLTGCGRSASEQARDLVENYNRVVAEAYRRGDVKLIDPVVGPNEGKKITGLIGVRLDLGLTLDSELMSLRVTSVEKGRDELRVQTQERWRYRDRKIGSGEQVGEASQDRYEMLYVFKKVQKAWVVDEIRFVAPPEVGRKQAPWLAERPGPATEPSSSAQAGGGASL